MKSSLGGIIMLGRCNEQWGRHEMELINQCSPATIRVVISRWRCCVSCFSIDSIIKFPWIACLDTHLQSRHVRASTVWCHNKILAQMAESQAAMAEAMALWYAKSTSQTQLCQRGYVWTDFIQELISRETRSGNSKIN
jgi:hypothetical protein